MRALLPSLELKFVGWGEYISQTSLGSKSNGLHTHLTLMEVKRYSKVAIHQTNIYLFNNWFRFACWKSINPIFAHYQESCWKCVFCYLNLYSSKQGQTSTFTTLNLIKVATLRESLTSHNFEFKEVKFVSLLHFLHFAHLNLKFHFFKNYFWAT